MIVFLSYASSDYFFAEMLSLKLKETGIEIWRDLGQLRAGDDWRESIEKGIFESDAVVVALSEKSSQSAYVTYEWAYALGQGRTLIPIKLADCVLHPKLEPIQYLDFSYPRALPWKELIQRIKDVESEQEFKNDEVQLAASVMDADKEQTYVSAILEYLMKRGYRMASFERLRKRIDLAISDDIFAQIISNNPNIFRHARLKGNKKGIARRFS